MANGNGKHKAQIERFKAQVETLGGKNPIVSIGRRDYMIGFEYDGELYRVRCALADSAAQTDHQLSHCMIVAIGYLQTLKFGAVWTCKKE